MQKQRSIFRSACLLNEDSGIQEMNFDRYLTEANVSFQKRISYHRGINLSWIGNVFRLQFSSLLMSESSSIHRELSELYAIWLLRTMYSFTRRVIKYFARMLLYSILSVSKIKIRILVTSDYSLKNTALFIQCNKMQLVSLWFFNFVIFDLNRMKSRTMYLGEQILNNDEA